MTIARLRPLNAADLELVRLVACGHSNEEISEILGISTGALMNRMNTVHRLVGSYAGTDRKAGGLSRVRMVIWAYANGLMDTTPGGPGPGPVLPPKPAQQPPDSLPSEVATPLLALCWDIYHDRPRGDLRRHAADALRAAGLLPRTTDRRAQRADAA